MMAAGLIGQGLLRGSAWAAGTAAQFQFSVMLWTLEKQMPMDRALEVVAAAGYQGVELVGEFENWSPTDTRLMMRKMKSLGLVFDAMSGVKAGFADPGESAAFLTQLDNQIRWARVLGCAKIILLSGKKLDGVQAGAQKTTAIENLKHAAEMAAKANVDLVIEPIDPLENPTIYLTSVTEGFEIVRAVNSPRVKVLYDFYHEQRAFGNLIEKLEQNIDWVGLVHVADVPGRHEPGTGEIDYASIYRKLAELKYRGFIAMEFYPTRDPESTLRKARLEALQDASGA
jgi:hydroxypyruvate isomerase